MALAAPVAPLAGEPGPELEPVELDDL